MRHTFSVKGQTENISGFVGHSIFVAFTQLGQCSVKAAMDLMDLT